MGREGQGRKSPSKLFQAGFLSPLPTFFSFFFPFFPAFPRLLHVDSPRQKENKRGCFFLFIFFLSLLSRLGRSSNPARPPLFHSRFHSVAGKKNNWGRGGKNSYFYYFFKIHFKNKSAVGRKERRRDRDEFQGDPHGFHSLRCHLGIIFMDKNIN